MFYDPCGVSESGHFTIANCCVRSFAAPDVNVESRNLRSEMLMIVSSLNSDIPSIRGNLRGSAAPSIRVAENWGCLAALL